jgi:arylsulfatase A-like enzyme
MMKHPAKTKRITGLLCAFYLIAALHSVALAQQRPNILFILADDLGYGDLSCYGNENPTPHIDSLARDGVRFTDFYVAASTCTPSRFALLTGRAPVRSRDALLNPLAFGEAYDNDRGIRPDETTIATRLRERGYRTAIIGKWHLGHSDPKFLPTRHGFDYFYGFTGGAIDYFTFHYGKVPDLHRNEQIIEQQGYTTDLITDEAVRFLQAQTKEQPFFLYLPYNAPHFGKPFDEAKKVAVNRMQAKPEDLARFSHLADLPRREYAAMMASLDDGVGRVLAALKANSLERDTLVIFASDNGGVLQLGGVNKPLRDQKGTLFEGGIRVPCLVRWPGHIPAGRILREPASMLDWFPTWSALTGLPTRGALVDGVNLWPWLSGKGKLAERPLFWREVKAARDGGKETRAIRVGQWKMVRTAAQQDMLFKLQADLAEQNDLSQTQPEMLRRLRTKLDRWALKTVPSR